MRTYLLLFLAGLITLGTLGCNETGNTPLAALSSSSGTVLTRVRSGDELKPAQLNQSIFEGGAVRTKEDGRAVVTFSDHGIIRIAPDTYVEILSKTIRGRQTEGKAVYQLKKSEADMQVETPHGVTAVLGTTFFIAVDKASTTVSLEEGEIRLRNTAGDKEQVLKPGQRARIESSGTISAVTELDPFTRETLFGSGKTNLPGINQH